MEKLLKRRESMHIDVVKEFYARSTLVYYKKKDIARSSVRVVDIKNVVPKFGKRDNTSYMDLIYMDHSTSVRMVNPPRGELSVVDSKGENRRRDDEEATLAENEEVEEPESEAPTALAFPTSPGDSTNQQKETEAAGVDPLGPTGHIPDSVMSKLQAEFERARANRIQAALEKAQAENARLLALLQQAQSQPKP
ncbi:hypothetical protein Dimus_020471 [Dionaea muscipula]